MSILNATQSISLDTSSVVSNKKVVQEIALITILAEESFENNQNKLLISFVNDTEEWSKKCQQRSIFVNSSFKYANHCIKS